MATTNTTLISLIISVALVTLMKTGMVQSVPVVSFTSNLPRAGPVASVACKVGGVEAFTEELTPDKEHIFSAAKSDNYACAGIWVAFVASFNGFNPGRDGANQKLFWMVDQSGWYLSYDNVKFTKQADWIKA